MQDNGIRALVISCELLEIFAQEPVFFNTMEFLAFSILSPSGLEAGYETTANALKDPESINCVCAWLGAGGALAQLQRPAAAAPLSAVTDNGVWAKLLLLPAIIIDVVSTVVYFYC